MNKTLTYGILPTREEFETIYEQELGNDTMCFCNDKRLGFQELTWSQVWEELVKAHQERETEKDETKWEAIGDWMSSVLYNIEIEWV